MYTRTVFVLLFTWLLRIRHANSEDSTRGPEKVSDGPSNDLDSEWPVKVIECLGHEYELKCFEALLDERFERNSKLHNFEETGRTESSAEELTVKKLTTLMDDWRQSLSVHIKQEVLGILKSQNSSSVYNLVFNNLFQRKKESANKKAEVSGRKMKMKMNMQKMIPYMLVPGLFLAGVMPWVVPQIKMLVMTVGMLNQVAFTSALFSLIRGYVFDTTQNEHIFYVNHGYKNEKHHQHNHHTGFKRNDIILKHPKSQR